LIIAAVGLATKCYENIALSLDSEMFRVASPGNVTEQVSSCNSDFITKKEFHLEVTAPNWRPSILLKRLK
jgi:hypothetical protein